MRAIRHELVHKRAATEVLVTAVTKDDHRWTVRSCLPCGHPFHSDAVGLQAGYHDPLLVLEAFRQGCIAASHLFYDVPLGFRYTVRHYEFAVIDPGALLTDGEPAEMEFHIDVGREFRSTEHAPVTGLTVSATATRGGRPAMTLGGAFGWMTEDQWQRMRAGAGWETQRQPRRADPGIVGRRQPANVVLGEPVQRRDDRSACAAIVVDTGNPTFFDHPLDHLPGGLILEAARQLAVAALASEAASVLGPVQLRCDFHSFAELKPNCVVALASSSPLSFRADVQQSQSVRAAVELAFSPVEPSP